MSATAQTDYAVLAIKFRDIPDIINHKPCSRTFRSRYFKRGDREDETRALKELLAAAAKHGLTKKEIIKGVIKAAKMPAVETN